MLKDDMDTILDCIGGADGGVSFAIMKMRLEGLEKKADDGDETSNHVLEIVRRFAALIRVLGDTKGIFNEKA